MSVTFTVEDGTIVTGANSYVSVLDATDYISTNIHAAAAWTALDETTQQYLLIWCSRFLDQRAIWEGTPATAAASYGENYISNFWNGSGSGSYPTQPMRWPRANVKDIDGILIPSNVIPQALKNAVCEMARYMITTDRTVERPQDALTELKVDSVTIKFLEGYTLPQVPNTVGFILRGLGTISSGRVGYGKIVRA